MWTPNEVRGSRSFVRVNGDVVALMLELTSFIPGVFLTTPPSPLVVVASLLE